MNKKKISRQERALERLELNLARYKRPNKYSVNENWLGHATRVDRMEREIAVLKRKLGKNG